MSKTIEINGKNVLLGEPYSAPVVDLVGMEDYIKKILASWMAQESMLPLTPFLVGNAGIGKTRVVYECAKLTGKPFFIQQGREDLTGEDLVCMPRVSDDPEKKIDYILSNLGTALVMGGIYFADGICKLKPRALSVYESVLDDRRYVDSILLGERIYAHPGFRFIAATNPEDMSNHWLPEFMESRLKPVIHFGYPDRKETDEIIKTHYPALSKNGTELIDCFWSLWDSINGDKSPAPRDVLKVFSFAQNLAKVPQNLADCEAVRKGFPFSLEIKGDPATLKVEHLERAFEIFYNDNGRSN